MTNCKATHLSQPFVMYQAVRSVKAAVGTLDWEEEEEEISPELNNQEMRELISHS